MLTLLLSAALATEPAPPENPPFGWVSAISEDGRSWHRNPKVAPEPRARLEVALGAGFGFSWFDTSAWNEAWDDRGYDTLGPVQLTPLSINGELYANAHVPGFDYIQYDEVGGGEGASDVATKLRIQLTELSYGYLFYFGRGFGIAPRIGFAIADVEMSARPKGTRTWTEIANAPTDSLTVRKAAMIADLGVGITFAQPTGPRDALGPHPVFRFTLRVGGMVQLFDTAGWGRGAGDPVEGAPRLRLDGAYARIIVSPGLAIRSARVTKGTRRRP